MPATVTNRTLIIESQALFAKALTHVLKSDPSLQVVGEAAELTEAYVRSIRPDLILIDIDGDNIDINEAVIASRTASPAVKVCALSMHLQSNVMLRCLSAGVDGYIVKDATPNEFLRALKSVAAGDTYFDPRISGRLLRHRSNTAQFPDPNALSMRESDVVRLIVAGMTNKEIGANLHLSVKTIKNHVSRIFTKLNCTARTQAAVFALRTGLV
jgi:DNA-binding NarL/FixJ family response regulator